MSDDRIKSLASVWNLEVGVNVNDEFYVHFLGGYVVDPPFLVGVHGTGKTIQEAAEDYYRKICGKKIKIDLPYSKKEFYVV